MNHRRGNTANARATEIFNLCLLAGCPEKTAILIASGKSVQRIRTELMKTTNLRSGTGPAKPHERTISES